jgi:hypothetical protein
MKFLIIIIYVVLIVKSAKNFPNIDYLGSSYDIFQGSPFSAGTGGVDPGFRSPLFNYNYNSRIRTADLRYWVPDSVSIAGTSVGCSLNAEALEIHSSLEYSYQQSKTARTGLFLGFMSFGSSKTSEKVHTATSQHHIKYVSTKATCSVYRAALPSFSLKSIPLRDDFRWAIVFLSKNLNKPDDIYKFLEYYGTHFISEVDFGSSAVFTSEFTEEAYSTMQSSQVTTAAQASFLYFAGSSMSDKQKKDSKQFRSLRSSETQVFFGSKPCNDGDMKKWMSKSIESPFPIGYSLQEITKLMTSAHFPEIKNIDTVRSTLSTYINQKWCPKLGNCGKGTRISRFVSTSQPTKGEVSATVEVPAGWKLIGGGARTYSDPAYGPRFIIQESRPFDEKRWYAKARDLGDGNAVGKITVYAIGFYDPFDEFKVIQENVVSKQGELEATCHAPKGFKLVGGGFRGNNNGVTASYPHKSNGWTAIARDAVTTQVFCISIKPKDTNKYTIDVQRTENTYKPGYGTFEAGIAPLKHYTLIGGGAINKGEKKKYTVKHGSLFHRKKTISVLAEGIQVSAPKIGTNRWKIELDDISQHGKKGQHVMTVFAIGMKINGKSA